MAFRKGDSCRQRQFNQWKRKQQRWSKMNDTFGIGRNTKWLYDSVKCPCFNASCYNRKSIHIHLIPETNLCTKKMDRATECTNEMIQSNSRKKESDEQKLKLNRLDCSVKRLKTEKFQKKNNNVYTKNTLDRMLIQHWKLAIS